MREYLRDILLLSPELSERFAHVHYFVGLHLVGTQGNEGVLYPRHGTAATFGLPVRRDPISGMWKEKISPAGGGDHE